MQALLESLKAGDKDYALARSLDPDRIPRHIAIIMDGNGRWAQRRRLPRVAGHKAGIEAVRATVEFCARMGIQALTLYAFSVENWKRPRSEVETLWRLLHTYIRKELPNLMKNNIRMRAIGRLRALPEQVHRDLESAMRQTDSNTGVRVNLAINYGGRAEIADAVNALIDEARARGADRDFRVDEEAIAARLYTAGLPDPDLLIRTSGEMRISNFLLWQVAYAEFYVTQTLWPDFRQTDLLEAVGEYQKRDRRFGGLDGARAAPVTSGEQLVETLGVSSK